MASNPRIKSVEYIQPDSMPADFDTRTLLKRGAWAVGLLVVFGLIALLAPGLSEVRDLIEKATPGWMIVAIALEVASSFSYVAIFRQAFCSRMTWRSGTEIGLSEVAVGSIVPASGAGGVALGAWILSRSGMPADIIAHRSVAFLLIKSSVNFIAVAVFGVLMFLGVGPHFSPLLTILPAGMAVAAIAAVPLLARWSRRAASGSTSRLSKVGVAIADGTTEARRLLSKFDPYLLGGALGYWIFDNLVLLAAFHAFGVSPPLIVVLMAYLIGQLGGILPIPGGIGGIDGGLIGTLIVYGVAAAPATAAVLLYRIILFWVPLIIGVPAFISLRRGIDDTRRPDLCLPVPG